jgi:hypothetical protein
MRVRARIRVRVIRVRVKVRVRVGLGLRLGLGLGLGLGSCERRKNKGIVRSKKRVTCLEKSRPAYSRPTPHSCTMCKQQAPVLESIRFNRVHGQDEPRQDKRRTSKDETRQDKTRQDKTRPCEKREERRQG